MRMKNLNCRILNSLAINIYCASIDALPIDIYVNTHRNLNPYYNIPKHSANAL